MYSWFIKVCYLFAAFYNVLLLWASCFVRTGAADVEGDSGACRSSLPAWWKWLRSNVLEMLAINVFSRAVLLQEAYQSWCFWSIQICSCRNTQESYDSLNRAQKNKLRFIIASLLSQDTGSTQLYLGIVVVLTQTTCSSLSQAQAPVSASTQSCISLAESAYAFM